MCIAAIRNPTDGEIVSDPQGIARVLTEHWQKVFNAKSTDVGLRQSWIHRLRNKMDVSLDELRPTMEDVEDVLKNLPTSAPGPDGIPFKVFRLMFDITREMFYKLAQAMIDGEAFPPEGV